MLGRAEKHVLPLLWYPAKSADPLPPEEGLNVALLEHAVGIFQRYAFAPDRGSRMIFADIDAWFASDDASYPSAFVSICNSLGLDVAYVRQGLRQWRESPREALGREERDPRDLGSRIGPSARLHILRDRRAAAGEASAAGE